MDPVILQIGSFKLQYYGLMYIVAFAITYGLATYRLRREDRFQIDAEQLQGLMTAMILGLIVGARLGYVLFYNLSYYLHHPLDIILPFRIFRWHPVYRHHRHVLSRRADRCGHGDSYFRA